MVGKHDEKLDSGISSLAKCGGCKATGRIIIGSKSDIITVNTQSMGSVLRLVRVISCLSWMMTVQIYFSRYVLYLHSILLMPVSTAETFIIYLEKYEIFYSGEKIYIGTYTYIDIDFINFKNSLIPSKLTFN